MSSNTIGMSSYTSRPKCDLCQFFKFKMLIVLKQKKLFFMIHLRICAKCRSHMTLFILNVCCERNNVSFYAQFPIGRLIEMIFHHISVLSIFPYLQPGAHIDLHGQWGLGYSRINYNNHQPQLLESHLIILLRRVSDSFN